MLSDRVENPHRAIPKKFQDTEPRMRCFTLIVLLIWLTALTACSGFSSGQPNPSTASLSISPTSATVASNGTQQFAATVQNSSNTSVTWSASAGTISRTGLFVAPAVTNRTTVILTAVLSNSSVQASAIITVNPASQTSSLSILPSAPPDATAKRSYSASFSATGGKVPYQWNFASGTVPPGLKLNSSSGLLTGTPGAPGRFSFAVTVEDSSGQNATHSFQLTVKPADGNPPPPLSIATSALPAATAGRAYAAPLSATGGQIPYRWSLASGTLPTGIQLNSASGLFSGTTQASGGFSFEVMVQDASGQTATQVLGLTVNSVASIPVIPASFFGMHVAIQATSLRNPGQWGTPILQPIVIGAMGKCVITNWPYVEQTPGQYHWRQIDTCTDWAAHYGIKYFESAHYMTPAAIGATDPANDPRCWQSAVAGTYFCQGAMTAAGEQEWIGFNATMALRYKGNPAMDFYEGWNEPPYAGSASVPPLKASELAQIERDRVTAIHSSDPNAKVASPAFIIDPKYPSYATFLDDFLGSNPPVYDYYNFHINYPNIPEDEAPMIVLFKQILASHGIKSPTIYASEAGRGGSGIAASVDTCPAWPSKIGVDLQQAFIGRMELLYWSQGIARHYWYAYDTCGTLTNQPQSNSLNPAGVAYGIIESWMIGATMTQACTGPAAPARGVWTCGLTKPDGKATLAVWDSSQSCVGASCTTSSYSYDSSYSKYYTLTNGNAQPLSGGTVSIGAKPILLSQ